MNPFKSAFKARRAPVPPLDMALLVRASMSASSVDIETVDLDITTDSSEWDTDDERSKLEKPNVIDENVKHEIEEHIEEPEREPDWSALPVVAFSSEVYDPQHPKKVEVVSVVDFRKSPGAQPYRNLVLIVVAELHQVLSLQLPRYIVGLLSNYRYMSSSQGKLSQVEQMDLYLSNVQEYLQNVRDCDQMDYQSITIRTGRTISVLASILELVGRNASHDVFLLSFQKQMISAFNMNYLLDFSVQTEYLEYLLRRAVSRGEEQQISLGEPEIRLANAKIQTEPTVFGSVGVQTGIFELTYLENELEPACDLSETATLTTNAEEKFQQQIGELTVRNFELEELMQVQHDQFNVVLDEKVASLDASNAKLARLHIEFFDLEERYKKNLGQLQASGDSARHGMELHNLFSTMSGVLHGRTRQLSKLCHVYSELAVSKFGKLDKNFTSIRVAKEHAKRGMSAQQTDMKRLLKELLLRDSELGAVQKDIAHLHSSLRVKDGEIRSLKTETEILQKKSDGLFADLLRNEERFRESVAENEELNQKVTRFSTEVLSKEKRLQHEREENEFVEAKIADLSTNCRNKDNLLHSVRLENEELQKETARLRSGYQVTTESLQTSKSENAALVQKITQLENARVKLDEKYAAAVMDASKNKDHTIHTLQAGLAAAIADNNEIQSDLQELKQQRKLHLEALRKLDQGNKDLNALLTKKEEDLMHSNHQVSSQQEQITAVGKTMDDKQQLLSACQEQLTLSVDNVSKLEQQFTFLNQERISLSSELQACQKKLTEALFRESETKDHLEQVNAVVDQMRRDLLAKCHELETNKTILQTKAEPATNDEENPRVVWKGREQSSPGAGIHTDPLVAAKKRIRQLESQLSLGSRSSSESSFPSQPVTRDDGLATKIKDLELEIEQKENVIRAVEYGKNTLELRISGLQTDNQHCENRIKDLEKQLSIAAGKYAHEIESRTKDYETRLRDALSRLSQKGEQYEFAKSNAEKLIKKQEGLNAEVAQMNSKCFQADLRVERITDQKCREIDELELQIKALQEQESRIRPDVEHAETGTLTENTDTSMVASVQTSISFQYGYDFDSGCQIRDSIFVNQMVTKEMQCQWPREPRDVLIQASPQSQCVGIQTATYSHAVSVQTDVVGADSRSCQTDVEDRRTCSTQTTEGVIFVERSINSPIQALSERLSPRESVAENSRLINLASSAFSNGEKEDKKVTEASPLKPAHPINIVARELPLVALQKRLALTFGSFTPGSVDDLSNCSESSTLAGLTGTIVEDLDEVEDVSVISKESEINSVPVRFPRISSAEDCSVTEMEEGSVTEEVQVVGRTFDFSTLHSVCQYLYDTLVKNSDTYDVLVQLSSTMDYKLPEGKFDRQFSERFLTVMETSQLVRSRLVADWKGDVNDFVQKLRNIIDGEKGHEDKSMILYPEVDDTSWQFTEVFPNKIEAGTAQKLLVFFKWSAGYRLGDVGGSWRFKINGKVPVTRNGHLSLEQFQEVRHFNNYISFCFMRIVRASKNLKKTFYTVTEHLMGLPEGHFDIKFAKLSIGFGSKSNKIKDLVRHELRCDSQRFFCKYADALQRRCQRSNDLSQTRTRTGFANTLRFWKKPVIHVN